MQAPKTIRTASRRRGVLSMELVLTLPIFGVLLMGLLEFSLLMSARADIAEACRAGARQATLYGASADDVENAVRSALRPGLHDGLQVTANINVPSGEPVGVAVAVPMGAASPDLLWPIGFTLGERQLYCEVHMAKE